MEFYRVKTGSILPLGKQGENLVRQIQFDLSRWISNFGPGTVQLLHQRSGDEAPYPVAVEREGNLAVWTVTSSDTAAVGQTVKITAVDENGQPTEWEAVEFPSGDVGYMKLLFDITTTEPVLKIETGIDLNQYSDIFAYCTSVSSDETKNTHFDWLVFGDSDMNSVRIKNGLHATQKRMFALRLSRLFDNVVCATAWRGSTAYKFSSMAEGGVVEQVNIGGTILNNFCCMAYSFGGTMLAAGTKLTVYGR